MNYPEFMTTVEEIYGQYHSAMLKKITARYIRERWKETELDKIMEQLVLRKPSKYKTPPDPAELEELFPRRNPRETESEALRWWDELNRKTNSYRDCVISDIRVQAAIETMGGWIWFCQRMKTDESGKDLDQWYRKQFVGLFILNTANPPQDTPRILPGLSEIKKTPVMIGESDVCLRIEKICSKSLRLVENMTEGMRV